MFVSNRQLYETFDITKYYSLIKNELIVVMTMRSLVNPLLLVWKVSRADGTLMCRITLKASSFASAAIHQKLDYTFYSLSKHSIATNIAFKYYLLKNNKTVQKLKVIIYLDMT